MFPHVFGAATGDSKAGGGDDILDLLVREAARWISFSNVCPAGMSGSQPEGTSVRRSARLKKKSGGVIVLDLPSTSAGERARTTSRLEGDIIVLSLDEPAPTCPDPVEAAGLFTLDEAGRTEAESGGDETVDAPMARPHGYRPPTSG